MSGCVYKLQDGRCDKPGRYLSPCIGEACSSQTPSNYDRIVSMTPEELAWWISDAQYIQRDPAEWEMWLKSPVEE